jgi:pimeloyl-ACP methyl ester carboxylesterase
MTGQSSAPIVLVHGAWLGSWCRSPTRSGPARSRRGGIPRTYVRCSADRAILPALQNRFIAEADAAFPENPTAVVDLDTSHSPFLSQPGRLAAAILEA